MGEPKTVHKYSVKEYLAMEEAAEYRSEFVDGEIFAMAGGSPVHDMICSECQRVIGNAILGSGCETHTSNMKVRNESSSIYYYPDLSVVCGKADFDADGVLLNPVLIVEVLSPSNEAYDRGEKFRRYKQISSMREYVLITQSEAQIDVFYKTEAGFWRHDSYEGVGDIMELRSLGIQVALADIYRRVSFE
ncbi:MAG TPA: Uma2 family endonuclease [Bacteroidia bacterium]|nr:Uma2 family endonuclease [Bacteroidia bacterium]